MQRRWSPLERGAQITDRALAVPLPIDALLDAALTDDTIVGAYRLKRHPAFLAERAEGEANALLIVLAGRNLEPTAAERQRILAERDLDRLERWLAAAGTCTDLAELLALP